MKLSLVDDEDTGPSVEDLIRDLREAQDKQADAKNRVDLINKQLTEKLTSMGRKNYEIPLSGGKAVRATRIANSRIQIDEAGLKKAIGARVFNTLTVRKLDRSLLDTAVGEKKVDGTIVKQFIKSVDHPYVKLYDVKQEDTDDGSDGVESD